MQNQLKIRLIITVFKFMFLSSKVLIRFEIYHADNSTAEAYDVRVGLFLPLYVTFNQIEQTNSTFIPFTNDSAVFFNVKDIKKINYL